MVRFADAGSAFDGARFVIFGVPKDDTCSFRRGARLAPLYIRMSSYNFETWDPGSDVDLTRAGIHDMGDIDPTVETVEDASSGIIDAGKVPLMLGGEHTVTIGACAAHDWDVLYIDAHADYRDEYLGDPVCHATVARRLVEQGHRVVHVGGRSSSSEEYEGFMKDVLVPDTGASADEIISNLSSERVYVTIDMDGIDPSSAPGVGTPEMDGLSVAFVRELITKLGPRIGGLDIVEVCPPYDPEGATSLIAAGLIGHAIRAMASEK